MTDRDRTHEPDERPTAGNGSDAESDFRFDCEFCDETLRTPTAKRLKSEGVAHLEAHHYTDLATVFAETSRSDDCENDCGYVFPATVEEVAGFDCPDCGYDHFPSFASQYVYWRIEES